jgi:two-component system nitrogen regulation response regulator GlnG
MAHVLIIDDEPNICWAFEGFLSDDGHRVSIASTAEAGLSKFANDRPDLMFLDIRLPGLDGLSAIERFRTLGPDVPMIVMTAFGTVETAVRAVKEGAFDYLAKPFDLSQLRTLIDRALATRSKHDRAPHSEQEPDAMVGRSLPMQAIFKQVAMAAACNEPVLITGESGTGKELVARATHRHSAAAKGPFVAVHLAAMPESLVERELFGHEKGAYTGAESARPGLIDLAKGGTIFFDEIAEAPLSIQAKLLRVLDGGEYRAVGGGQERRIEARVIAATNRDLITWSKSGQFRSDLYYRLAVLPIQLPPLRERPDDILPLWDHFMQSIDKSSFVPVEAGSELARRLLHHNWPGNVRELRNVAEHSSRQKRLPVFAAAETASELDSDTGKGLAVAVEAWLNEQVRAGEPTGLYERFQRTVEAPLLQALFAKTGGNQAKMSRILGVHRTTLRGKLRELGLDPSKNEINE